MSNVQTPLTPALFNVLLALSDGEKHGYAILKEVEEHTRGEVQLSTGTLYGIIKRLLADGLIAELRSRPAVEMDDQRRRYYRLTEDGRRMAVAEAERMAKVLARARGKRLIRSFRSA
ncbi:MAG: PadR family transcriptional regulator [Acidobacteriia bacterium]|nr:PadR family transcriptional regulator [Terriglobia bacterium]